ncbi:MAG: hypothetical protein PHU85_20290 [Phycisphaerae bacterium]|nr:hypothetical protein [Phycisphaerae bacterium]
MKTTIEMVGPQRAKEFLEHYVPKLQRKPSLRHVSDFARAMRAGQWMLTHQGMAFDEAENLIDGVQRCLAIIESGVTIQTMVTRGIPLNGGPTGMQPIDAMDRCKPRGIGQQLQLRHEIKDGNIVSAACRAIIGLACKKKEIAPGANSVAATLAVLESFGPEIRHCVANRNRLPGIRTSAAIGAFAFAMRPYPQDIKRAYEQYVIGENIARGNPMFALRAYVISKTGSTNGSTTIDIARTVLMACEKYVAGSEMRTAKVGESGLSFFASKQQPTLNKLLLACGYFDARS